MSAYVDLPASVEWPRDCHHGGENSYQEPTVLPKMSIVIIVF